MKNNKFLKKISFAAALCLVVNAVSLGFGVVSASATENDTTTYNFNDGVLPSIFDANAFSVENNMLKANSNLSGFIIDNLSKNYVVEFKMKPLEGETEQAFGMSFGNVNIFFDGANGKDSSWSDSLTLKKRKDGTQLNKIWGKKGYFPDRTNGHTLKVEVIGSIHNFYIDNNLILTSDCSEAASTNCFDFGLSKNVATAGVYLDDIIITKKEDTEEEAASGSLFAYDFNDGKLPARFNSAQFSVENKMLKANGPGSEFAFSDVPKNSTVEFDIKPFDGSNIPGFSLQIGNTSITYNPNMVNPSKGWNDEIVLYNRVTWDSSEEIRIWADGKAGRPSGNFFPSAAGYKIKVVSYGDTHTLYIDNLKVASGEFTGKLSSAYNLSFIVTSAINTGLYADNLVVKDSSLPYNYDFNNGVLPTVFDSENFAVSDGMLYVRGANAKFTLGDLSNNSSVEFKIKPLEGEAIPQFSLEIGKGYISYADNNSQNNTWNDAFNFYNRINWENSEAKHVYADGKGGLPKGSFFPSSDGHIVKFVAKDSTHSLYIDDKLIVSGELSGESVNKNIIFTVSKNAATGFYIDDFKVKLSDYEPEFNAAVSISDTAKTCNVNIKNIENENVIIFAAYKGDKLVDVQFKNCENDIESFTLAADIDSIKVMLWKGIDNIVPVYDAIFLPQASWISAE